MVISRLRNFLPGSSPRVRFVCQFAFAYPPVDWSISDQEAASHWTMATRTTSHGTRHLCYHNNGHKNLNPSRRSPLSGLGLSKFRFTGAVLPASCSRANSSHCRAVQPASGQRLRHALLLVSVLPSGRPTALVYDGTLIKEKIIRRKHKLPKNRTSHASGYQIRLAWSCRPLVKIKQ